MSGAMCGHSYRRVLILTALPCSEHSSPAPRSETMRSVGDSSRAGRESLRDTSETRHHHNTPKPKEPKKRRESLNVLVDRYRDAYTAISVGVL